MAIKFAKTKRSESRMEYMKKYHHDRRKSCRDKVTVSMGGKCVQCGSIQNLCFFYKLKKKRVGPTLGSLMRNGPTNYKKAMKLRKKYELLCRPHYFIKWRATLPQRQHGTPSTYASGKCRCTLCRAAWNEYTKAWHKKKYAKRRAARQLLKEDSFRKLFQ